MAWDGMDWHGWNGMDWDGIECVWMESGGMGCNVGMQWDEMGWWDAL